MNTPLDNSAFDRGTDQILQFFTADQARRIVNYRGDDALQKIIQELSARSNEGDLTDAEQADYEGYVRANKFVAILQAKARTFLAQQRPE